MADLGAPQRPARKPTLDTERRLGVCPFRRWPSRSAGGRAVVTENVADFCAERDVVLVFVLKKNLPARGGQAAALAKILDRRAQDYPDPYLGPHWPAT